MTNDIKDRALDLLEQEDRGNRHAAERRAEQEQEGRLRDAITRVKAQDKEIAAEQARKDAEAEAEKLAVERHDLEQRIEAEAMAVNRSLSELQSLHKRQTDALRRAGRPLGHGHGLNDLITPWWRDRFGGFNSLTGTPSPHFNSEGLPLPERDPMARQDGS